MPFPTSIQHPSGAKLTLVPDKVLVKVAASPTARSSDRLTTMGLTPLQQTDQLGKPSRTAAADTRAGVPGNQPHSAVNNSEELVFTQTSDGKKYKPTQDVIAADNGAEWVAPVYAAELSGHTEYLSPKADAIIVPSAALDPAQANVLKAYGLTHDEARSQWLGEFEVFTVEPGHKAAFEIRDELAKKLGTEVKLEFVPLITPVAMTPNDPLFRSQWDMVQIGAAGGGTTGWDLQQGSPSVAIAILDEGVDLNHPDLVGSFLHSGINLGTMNGTGAPTGNHGTPCAGIAAAPINNAVGTAGVAGGCRILPIAFDSWSDTEVAAGIRYATQEGARVVSMSFGWNGWDRAIIDPAIAEAHAAGVVLVAATHNHNTANGITYPATHPLVIAVGASDQADNRKSPSSPDGEPWGSNYGPQISVVAPGVLCPAPDRVGSAGYSSNDYTMTFNGTSAATPHVAGLAALLLSRRPSLSNVDVRDIIEQTAAKVGTVGYATRSGYRNGTWNNQMGYGRIDVVAALGQVPDFYKPPIFEHDLVIKHRIPEFDIPKRIPEFDKRLPEFDKRLPEFDKRFPEIDPVKIRGMERPDLLVEPREPVLERLNDRLDKLERTVNRIGASFIDQNSRPEV